MSDKKPDDLQWRKKRGRWYATNTAGLLCRNPDLAEGESDKLASFCVSRNRKGFYTLDAGDGALLPWFPPGPFASPEEAMAACQDLNDKRRRPHG